VFEEAVNKTAPSRRTTNYSKIKDEALIKAWKCVSLDAVTGLQFAIVGQNNMMLCHLFCVTHFQSVKRVCRLLHTWICKVSDVGLARVSLSRLGRLRWDKVYFCPWFFCFDVFGLVLVSSLLVLLSCTGLTVPMLFIFNSKWHLNLIIKTGIRNNTIWDPFIIHTQMNEVNSTLRKTNKGVTVSLRLHGRYTNVQTWALLCTSLQELFHTVSISCTNFTSVFFITCGSRCGNSKCSPSYM
jgi:hypothetical protein